MIIFWLQFCRNF